MNTAERKNLMSEVGNFVRFIISELKPKGKILTPFNVITGAIILAGGVLIVIRFVKGLGATTNLSQDFPWGIWIGFDVMGGVAIAAGGYVIPFMVYILGLEKYHPIVRPAVLTGFLGYCFYGGALLLDLGRPWHVINPLIGNSFGLSSVLFLIAWHFFLYTICEFVEFSPAITEWLGWKRIRQIVGGLTVGAVIFGITLSTLHQSALGALFLMAPTKVHPLWYTNLPVLFFVSSIFGGLSMVIVESSISHKVFQVDPEHHASFDDIVVGLGKAAAGTLFLYFTLKIISIAHGNHWHLLNTSMGHWYLVELIGFVVIPCLLFTYGVRTRNVKLIQTVAFFTVVGVLLNRLNVSIIAFKWDAANRYVPSWMEIVITLAVICAEMWAFRWVVNRMPVLTEHKGWEEEDNVVQMKKEVA